MDKETLSHYGWIVVLVLVLSVLLAMATPFGSFIASGFKSTYTGLFDVSKNALNILDIANPGQAPEEIPQESVHHTGVVPDGGIYIPIDTLEELGPGEPLPETPKKGDEYFYGDYRYGYETTVCATCADFDTWHGCMNFPQPLSGGWSVLCEEDKEEPGVILRSICGKPIIDMNYTFRLTNKMTTSPTIPETVVTMEGTYQYKKNLVNAAKLPDGLDALMWTYVDCTSLEVAPAIPSSVKNLQGTFNGCTSLKIAPVIPEGVENMSHTFRDCTSLKTAPIIPQNVETMFHIFRNCTSLTGDVIFNCSIEEGSLYDRYEDTFTGVNFEEQKITLKGTSTKLDEYGLTGLNYCTTCNGCCQGHDAISYSIYYNKLYWGEVTTGTYVKQTKMTGVVIYEKDGEKYIYSFTKDENGKWIADNYHEKLESGENGDFYDDYGTHYVISADGKTIQYTDGMVNASGTLTLDSSMHANGIQYDKEYVDNETGYTIEFENTNSNKATFTDASGKSKRRDITFISPYCYKIEELGIVYLEIDEPMLKVVN